MEERRAKKIAQVAEDMLPVAATAMRDVGMARQEVPYVLITMAIIACARLRDNEGILSPVVINLAQNLTESLVISMRKNGFEVKVPENTEGKVTGSANVFDA